MAVAIKKLGFKNITIYNGGLKDWVLSGHKVVSIDPLPDCKITYISASELLKKLKEAEARGCVDGDGNPLITILDFRSNRTIKIGADNYKIKTICNYVSCELDDLIDKPEIFKRLPNDGWIVTISETGNRDTFAAKYLHKVGYRNVLCLKFGMRAWFKSGYPVEKIK